MHIMTCIISKGQGMGEKDKLASIREKKSRDMNCVNWINDKIQERVNQELSYSVRAFVNRLVNVWNHDVVTLV